MGNYIVGGCDGLVCILNVEGEIAIWNPLIKRYRKLPRNRELPSLDFCVVHHEENSHFSDSKLWWPLYAFGRDLHNDDYKVLRVVDSKVNVYSLKTNSRKRIEEKWPTSYSSRCSKPISFNGVLHYLMQTPQQVIVAFDLATEKFHVFKTPAESTWPKRLEVLGGNLCFILMDPYRNNYNFVWMVKEYGEDSSWTRTYKIEKDNLPLTCDFCKPLMFSKDRKKLVLEEGLEKLLEEALGWYDMEKKIDEKKRDRFRMHNVLYTVTCIGSLLLLDGGNVTEEKKYNYFEDYQKVEGSKSKKRGRYRGKQGRKKKKSEAKQLYIKLQVYV